MIKKIFITLTALVVIAAAAAGIYVYIQYEDYQKWLNSPIKPNAEESINFVIPHGAGPTKVFDILRNSGIITNERYYKLYVKLEKFGGKIKAGEYEIKLSDTPKQVFERIAKGQIATAKITIPEGWTVKQIARRLLELGILDAQQAKMFEQYCLSKQAAEDFGIDAPSLEGYLFPDTYVFAKHTSYKKVARAMVNKFKSIWTKKFDERAKQLGFTQNQIVTLASIVEKETGSAKERPIIASVYHNRLKIGMKLQADPTVIYGVKDYHGNITKKHLTTDHPYNTYTRKGLPPGPIASPGLEAIKATLYPAKTDYLYFVSKNDGTHKFSKTYAEHSKAVDKYQRHKRPAKKRNK